jgi:endonuclease/exonuclease/phosphatase family metal-dependent hydrolase
MPVWNVLKKFCRNAAAPRDGSPRLEQLEDRCLLNSGPLGLLAQPAVEADHPVTVMSYNLYQGSELNAIVAAPTLQAIPAAVSQVWSAVKASNFPQRALAITKEIVAAEPDIIGLQEAALWRIQTPGTAFTAHPTPATTVVYDFIDILVKDLAERGFHYTAVAISPSFDGQLPDATGDDIRLTDRVAILVRTDPGPRHLDIANVQTHKFAVNATVPLGGANGPQFTIYNSWASVDLTKNGQTFRFITTHLDSNVAAINEAEGNELLAGPANTNLPVILSGDFNSPADGRGPKSYASAIHAGFKDAWLQTNPHRPGFTCCEATDLLNPTPQLNSRIDYALLHGDVTALGMKTVGDRRIDRTSSGLWPSDHAGLVVGLEFGHDKKEHDASPAADSGGTTGSDGGTSNLGREIVVGLTASPAKVSSLTIAVRSSQAGAVAIAITPPAAALQESKNEAGPGPLRTASGLADGVDGIFARLEGRLLPSAI